MYILEGNIGAGKSTFLSLITRHLPHVSVGLEPLHNWHSESSGQSLLQNFYEDPVRWAYTLETLAMMSRIKEHQIEQTHPSPCRIVERSIYSGFHCFALNSYESGFLTPVEWSIYQEWFSCLTRHSCARPQGFIYLRIEPEIAFDRIKKRNRSAESSISLEYLTRINMLHDAFLLEKKGLDNALAQVPVLVLDSTIDFESNPVQLRNNCARLSHFLEHTCHTSARYGTVSSGAHSD